VPRARADEDARPWLVVGLGNPGKEYVAHRHNIGFRVADELGRRMGGSFRAHKRGRAAVLEGRSSTHRVIVIKPSTYMNDSGDAVAPLCDFYKTGADRVIAVHDELDLPFGSLRLKLGGGDNGHNGLRSLRKSLGAGEFYRVRIGVGRPPGRLDPAVYVLRDFGPSERPDLDVLIDRAADAVESLLDEGLDRTQSLYND
jgi:PTH1 family peptidyl-tRNA hydrolase